jgi:arylsulfatase A-like enzyme
MPQPNIIVFMMDALRPDHLGPWSPETRPTPNFSRLADEGVFFREFFGHMPSSFNARASVLTGRDPHTHGVKINGRPLSAKEITLPQILREAGYATALTTPYPKGMNRGFSENTLRNRFEGDIAAVQELLPGVSDGEATTDVAQDTAALVGWLRERQNNPQRSEQPFFLWADEEFSHGPWRPPAPWDTMYDTEQYDGPDASNSLMYAPDLPERHKQKTINLFDGCIAVIDKMLGYLIDELDTLGIAEDTLLVVMSDHGQLLGELGMWGKPPVLTDPVLRSVLVMRQKGAIPAGVQPTGLGIMNDVFATLLEHAGLELPESARGQCVSLSPLWNGVAQVRDQVGLEFNSYRGTAGKGIRTEKWKYIHYASLGTDVWKEYSPAEMWERLGWDRTVLFDLESDPGETRDVKAEHPDVVADMQIRMIDWLVNSEDDVPWPDPGD